MRTETSSLDDLRSRRRAILLGYNLPLILWTALALVQLGLGQAALWECPVREAIGWCPACGLTHAYGEFLCGKGLQDLPPVA
jgi:hypothetical protein